MPSCLLSGNMFSSIRVHDQTKTLSKASMVCLPEHRLLRMCMIIPSYHHHPILTNNFLPLTCISKSLRSLPAHPHLQQKSLGMQVKRYLLPWLPVASNAHVMHSTDLRTWCGTPSPKVTSGLTHRFIRNNHSLFFVCPEHTLNKNKHVF